MRTVFIAILFTLLSLGVHAETVLSLDVDAQIDVDTPRPAKAEGFHRRYRAAGKPRLVVFWNRNLVPDPQEGTSTTISGHVKESSKLSEDSDEERVAMRITVNKAREQAETGARLHRFYDPVTEMAFLQGLREAGVRLVDRNVAIRLMHKKVREADYEGRKLLEMDALVAYAEMLVEVEVGRDAKTSEGREYHVQVKDLRDGSLVAALFTPAATEEDRKGRYRAGERGFEKVIEPASPDKRGKQLAKELIAELNARL